MSHVQQRYRVIAPIGTGPEGARYRAVDADGRPLVLHFLHIARISEARLQEIRDRVRVLSSVDGPEIARVIDVMIERQRPAIAVDDASVRSLAEALTTGMDRSTGAQIALELLRALRQAHRLGLAHGLLSPFHVGLRADQSVCLDLCGLRTADLPKKTPEPVPFADERRRPSLETDIYAAAQLVAYLLGARRDGPLDLGPLALPETVFRALRAMLEPDRAARPTIGEALRSLMPWLAEQGAVPGRAPVDPPSTPAAGGDVLGRYRLLQEIGHGGIGDVYRAEEMGTGKAVAIKIVRGEYATHDGVLRRFRREARLLEQVRHRNIVELVEVNEAGGILYLAMELVDGPSLSELQKRRGRLPEREALLIGAEIARGLAVAHARGIVHRDVKPGNVLLGTLAEGEVSELGYRVKICDFGIARVGLDSDETSLTQNEALGTPRYMAPEQCVPGSTVTPAADVYALGMTLFQLLTGRIAYDAESTAELIYAHQNREPLELRELVPDVSAGVAELVRRALIKAPEDRPQDAAVFLEQIEALLGGRPLSREHPAIPHGVAPEDIFSVAHRFELGAAPEAVWRHVSNTERLNRAIGLPPVDWSFEPGEEGVRLFGSSAQVGLRTRWREHPYEWIEGQRLGVFREYSEGPLEWYVSAVSLVPTPAGGTTLTHRLWLKPRNALARAAAWIEAKHRLKGKLERVYQRIAVTVLESKDAMDSDPFEQTRQPIAAERRRLALVLSRMREIGASRGAVEALGKTLASAPDQEAARIRPLPLARRLGLPEREMVDACLIGAASGLLVPLWDVICPTCKIPSSIEDSLSAIKAHAFCPACSVGFSVDLANSVELIFRAHPDLRSSEIRTYCIGGPAHSPHAAAQLVLKDGERLRFELSLEEGSYELRTTRDDWRVPFRVEIDQGPSHMELCLCPGTPPEAQPVLAAGKQSFEIINRAGGERVFRVERAAPRSDAFSAADAAIHPLFRQLFPEQTFREGELISLESISLLITDLHEPEKLYESLGEVEMLGVLHRHLRGLAALVEEGGGSVLKAQSHGLVAAFPKVADAIAVGVKLVGPLAVGEGERRLPVTAAVHRGPAMAATVSERLDYFGRTVTRLSSLLALGGPGQVIASEEVAEEPGIEALWTEQGWSAAVVTMPRSSGALEFAIRLEPAPGASRRAS